MGSCYRNHGFSSAEFAKRRKIGNTPETAVTRSNAFGMIFRHGFGIDEEVTVFRNCRTILPVRYRNPLPFQVLRYHTLRAVAAGYRMTQCMLQRSISRKPDAADAGAEDVDGISL